MIEIALCPHPENIFIPPKHFAQQYPIEEKFLKKWAFPDVNPAISCLNKILMVHIEDALVFKDPVG